MKRLMLLMGIWVAPAVLMASGMPHVLTYQGTVKQAGIPATGSHAMSFKLTNSVGSAQYGSVVNLTNVVISQGLFSVELDFSANGTMPVEWDKITPYIQVSIDGQALSPAEPIHATAYALMSAAVVDGAITPAKLDPSVQTSMVAPGAIMAFGGPLAPPGWLVCDGSVVSRTAYAVLFQAIGITWGAGDGTFTFNLPDLRGRSPLGAGQGPGLTSRPLGAHNIGEESHTLTVAEIPANLTVNDPGHAHDISDPGHAHSLPGGYNMWTDGPQGYGVGFGIGAGLSPIHSTANSTTGISINPHQTGISVGGGGTPHNTLPPSAVVNFIIKS